jgi:ketosteroid isomerase-like protein
MSTEIRAFFESYRNAFNALDGEAVARLYAVPSGIASDTGYEHWPAYEPIRDNMVALCKLYKDNGYVHATFEPEAFLQQGEQYAMADLRWRIERSGGQPPWEFNTTYNLMRTAQGWRVLLCTAYSEKRLNVESGT